MVHYIRFLRTLRVSEIPKKGYLVSAVLSVTTDLGDAYFAADIDLVARLVDATKSNEVLATEALAWHEGSRAIKLNLSCSPKHRSRLARLHVTTQQTQSEVRAYHLPQVVDVWSERFSIQYNAHTDALVERQLHLSGTCLVRQWEETGDSIARHIWDASVGFVVLFQRLLDTSRQCKPSLSEIERLLETSPSPSPKVRLRVLEVGAGCGIVGIAWAQLRKSEVVLTDLPDAQAVLQANIACATPVAGSSLHCQVLEWGTSIDNSLAQVKFDLVLVSDCIYNPDSSLLLVETLNQLSAHNPNLVILVGFKRRHEADAIFFDRMHASHFSVAEETQIVLPHAMTDYDAEPPQVEFFVYRSTVT